MTPSNTNTLEIEPNILHENPPTNILHAPKKPVRTFQYAPTNIQIDGAAQKLRKNLEQSQKNRQKFFEEFTK